MASKLRIPKAQAKAKTATTAKPAQIKRKSAKRCNKAALNEYGLTAQQTEFASTYVVNGNITAAAISAGYSVKSARTLGARVLRNDAVIDYIATKRRELETVVEQKITEFGLTRERLARETARIAFFDPRKLFGVDGKPLAITELDDDTAAAIQGLDVLEEWQGSGRDRVLVGHVKKYKVADKNTAIDRGNKMLNVYKQAETEPSPHDADQQAKTTLILSNMSPADAYRLMNEHGKLVRK